MDEETADRTTAALHRKRILIFEDDITAFLQMQTVLSNQGALVWRGIRGGSGPRDSVAQWRPELVVVDIVLSDHDGWQVAGEIVAEFRVPVLVLTVISVRQVRRLMRQTRVRSWLPKPFTDAQLAETCAVALGALPVS